MKDKGSIHIELPVDVKKIIDRCRRDQWHI